MPRTKIDFHDTRADAEAALTALRHVGLDAGDVGGAWRLDDTKPFDLAGRDGPLISRQIVNLAGIGSVQLSGWLADIANTVSDAGPTVSLSEFLSQHLTDPEELARIKDTLAAGGGIVGVRARDTFSPEHD